MTKLNPYTKLPCLPHLKPQAAVGKFPYPHRTLAEVAKHLCPTCRGKSRRWRSDFCTQCNNTGLIP